MEQILDMPRQKSTQCCSLDNGHSKCAGYAKCRDLGNFGKRTVIKSLCKICCNWSNELTFFCRWKFISHDLSSFCWCQYKFDKTMKRWGEVMWYLPLISFSQCVKVAFLVNIDQNFLLRSTDHPSKYQKKLW